MLEINGKYIIINEYNHYFDHVAKMLLEYYDTHDYNDTVFLLGVYCKTPMEYFRELYPGKKLIVYQLEQLFSGGFNWHDPKSIITNIKKADEIWDYDLLNITYLKWHEVIVDKFSPMRYTNSLYNPSITNSNCDIDVLFYGFINERRFKILQTLQSAFYDKISIVWLYGIDYEHLDEYINRSKIILNLHISEPYNRQEQVRMFYPIINGKCVVSETSQQNYLSNSIVESNTESLTQTISGIIESGVWGDIGTKARNSFVLTADDYYYTKLTEHYKNSII